MKLEDKEQYLNIIKYLQTVLEFYANEDNYKVKPLDEKKYEESNIVLDYGSQAKFALKSIENISKEIQDTNDEYENILKNYQKHPDMGSDTTQIMDKLKDLL
ncbi:MAG: hypothetical protein ACOC33_04190, partial [bacterium]